MRCWAFTPSAIRSKLRRNAKGNAEMQITNGQSAAATRKPVVANGVPAHITTYFGTNFAVRGPDTPPPPGPEAVYPMGFLVEQSADSLVQAHFHAANQFQVVVGGGGMLGRQDVGPIAVQYANAFSSYGPLRAGSQGLHYFTLRNGYDPGARYVPGAAAELRHRPRRYRVAVAEPGPPLAEKDLARLTEAHGESLLPDAEDGLAAWRHRLPPVPGCAGRRRPRGWAVLGRRRRQPGVRRCSAAAAALLRLRLPG
ncbi:hypothetical protein ACFQU2_09635 [Siccirubricoccus deserti]